jgi:hypothetical protein
MGLAVLSYNPLVQIQTECLKYITNFPPNFPISDISIDPAVDIKKTNLCLPVSLAILVAESETAETH